MNPLLGMFTLLCKFHTRLLDFCNIIHILNTHLDALNQNWSYQRTLAGHAIYFIHYRDFSV